METLLLSAAIVAVLLGLAGIVLPLLPGMPLIFGGLWIIAWLDDFPGSASRRWLSWGRWRSFPGWSITRRLPSVSAAPVPADWRLSAQPWAPFSALRPGSLVSSSGRSSAPLPESCWPAVIACRPPVRFAAGLGFILAIVTKIGIAFTMLGIFAVAWLA